MRIDKFLKVSRLIKRRTIANEACDNSRIIVNNREVKASYNVKIGDIIQLKFGEKTLKVEVLNIVNHVLKDDASGLYKEIE